MPLVPLRAHPSELPWPTADWPRAEPGPDVDGAELGARVAELVRAAHPVFGETLALVVVHRGAIIAEAYAEGVDAGTTLPSWSLAKSVLSAVCGRLVGAGLLDLTEPVAHPSWAADDPRQGITVDHLLCMRASLRWAEDYVDAGVSDVIEMLFGEGARDMAAFTAAQPLVGEPGSVFCYSSGTSNLLAWAAGRAAARAPGADRERPLRPWLEELFASIGMTTATPKYDEVGTWVGSTYCFATARDLARFAYLHLRDGVWDGVRVLPEGWVDRVRTTQGSEDPAWGYGRHWWTVDPSGALVGRGYEGQQLWVVPDRDVVLVRCGRTAAESIYPLREDLRSLIELVGRA